MVNVLLIIAKLAKGCRWRKNREKSLCPGRDLNLLIGSPIRFHDNSSTDISSTTLRLQTFRLLLYTRAQDSYTSNFCFSKSLFSSISTSTYTMIPFINPTSTDTMIIQHI